MARETADIARLGYTISVERAAGVFDGVRQAMRVSLGLDEPNREVPDPARAARPVMLWQALGLAFEPRRFVPAAVALLVALASGWTTRGAGSLAGPVGAALAAVATTVAAAAATIAAAASTHELLAGGARLSPWAGLRALARYAGALVGASREAVLRTGLGVLLVASAALLAALGERGVPPSATLARATAPVQGLLVGVALTLAVDAAYRVLAYAAGTPGAPGRLAVQAVLEARRIAGERTLLPSRALAPALAAAMGLAVVLGGAGHLTITIWDAVAGAGPAAPGRALGRDVVWAVLGGIWCSYAGIAGLLAGYAVGTAAAHEPVRAPEIITGTWGAGLQVARDPKDPDRDDRTEEARSDQRDPGPGP
jgi:hypothetical protein